MADYLGFRVLQELQRTIKVNSDGSITRTEDRSLIVPVNAEFALDEDWGVVTRDVVLDEIKPGLWVRLYLPPSRTPDMPVLIYFHGGGFCLFSPSFALFHRFSLECAATLGGIMVSVNYRLAPEHRLPVAYEDSMAAIEWVRSQSTKKKIGEGDPWLESYADFSNVYLMGDSAGGNIAHHIGTWACENQREDLRIRGLILVQPFFGSEERTASEISCPEDAVLNLESTDKLWKFALPIGGNRDHPFCNPFGPESTSLADVALPPLLVFIGGRDLLRDTQVKYCEALKKSGKKIKAHVFEEEEHAFYVLKPEAENFHKLVQDMGEFILSNRLSLEEKKRRK